MANVRYVGQDVPEGLGLPSKKTVEYQPYGWDVRGPSGSQPGYGWDVRGATPPSYAPPVDEGEWWDIVFDTAASLARNANRVASAWPANSGWNRPGMMGGAWPANTTGLMGSQPPPSASRGVAPGVAAANFAKLLGTPRGSTEWTTNSEAGPKPIWDTKNNKWAYQPGAVVDYSTATKKNWAPATSANYYAEDLARSEEEGRKQWLRKNFSDFTRADLDEWAKYEKAAAVDSNVETPPP